MANEAFDIIVSSLKRNPQATFASIRDKAAAKGHTIYPVSYGRAKALLGLVKSKPRKDRVATATTTAQEYEIKQSANGDVVIAKPPKPPKPPKAAKPHLNNDAMTNLKALGAEINSLRRFKAKVTALLTTCD